MQTLLRNITALSLATVFSALSADAYRGMTIAGRENHVSFATSDLPALRNEFAAQKDQADLDKTAEIAKLDQLLDQETLCEQKQDYAEEEKVLLKLIDLLKNSNVLPKSLLGTSLARLAAVYIDNGKWKEAETPARQGLPYLRQSFGPLSPDLAIALNNLGWIEYRLGKLEPAKVHIKMAVDIAQKLYGPTNPMYGWMSNNLGQVFEASGDRRTASLWYKRSDQALFSKEEKPPVKPATAGKIPEPKVH